MRCRPISSRATRRPSHRVDVDPITLDIIENALRNARTEMDAVLFRTAMSPGIREQHDAFPMIANQEGKMVVGQFGSFLHGFIAGYEGDIEDGDIFITNDPYSCNGAVSHLNDWLLMMPIFHEDRLVSWAAMFGHMTDVGGKVPGSLPTDAKMIYEEGLILPPTKIYRRGELNSEVLNIMLANSRVPEWNKSDFYAIIASLRLAERRVRENIEALRRRHLHLRHVGHAGPQPHSHVGDHPDDHSGRRPQGAFRRLDR